MAASGATIAVDPRCAVQQRLADSCRNHRGGGQDPLAPDRQSGGLPRRDQSPAARRHQGACHHRLRGGGSLEDDERTSISRTNGKETLAVSVTKKPEGDTVAISHAVAGIIGDLEAELGSNAKFTPVFDQAPFIEKSIKDLTTEGLLGLGFAVAVILVFLMSTRSTLVTAVSIPLSLLITFIGLSATGYSLNILTLGALTIAIGRVVDDSIVVIENIKRHLAYGEDKVTAILTAIREVAGAITASTLTTVAVFLPIAFVGELAGELFRPFALTVTMALLASLLVSLTIVPVLAYWFLKTRRRTGSAAAREAAAAVRARAQKPSRRAGCSAGYLPVLTKTQKHPVVTLIAAVLVLAATGAMTPLLATDLLGQSGQNSLTVRQVLPAWHQPGRDKLPPLSGWKVCCGAWTASRP